jgi:hypothetical protein
MGLSFQNPRNLHDLRETVLNHCSDPLDPRHLRSIASRSNPRNLRDLRETVLNPCSDPLNPRHLRSIASRSNPRNLRDLRETVLNPCSNPLDPRHLRSIVLTGTDTPACGHPSERGELEQGWVSHYYPRSIASRSNPRNLRDLREAVLLRPRMPKSACAALGFFQ